MIYYSIYRPIGPGTIPSIPKPVNIENFDRREFVEAIGRSAWGYVEYEEPLDEKTAADYELVKPKEQYFVRFSVTGHFTACVQASSIEEAKEEAIHMFEESDFGELNDVDGDISGIEDENGRFIGGQEWKRS